VGVVEQHSAVDDQQPPLVLEDGPIATDLAEPAEGHYAQAVLRQRWRGAKFRMRIAHRDTPAPYWQFVAVTSISVQLSIRELLSTPPRLCRDRALRELDAARDQV